MASDCARASRDDELGSAAVVDGVDGVDGVDEVDEVEELDEPNKPGVKRLGWTARGHLRQPWVLWSSTAGAGSVSLPGSGAWPLSLATNLESSCRNIGGCGLVS